MAGQVSRIRQVTFVQGCHGGGERFEGGGLRAIVMEILPAFTLVPFHELQAENQGFDL